MGNEIIPRTSETLSVNNAGQLIESVKSYGEIIAKGGLFNCRNAEQGQTLVLMAMSEGVPITQLRKKYHIIGGTDLSMRADWMLADFRRIGGWYQWINQGDDGKVATLHVKYKENDMQVSYTIEMANKAGLVKPKSGWQKNPGEMLRSRCQTKAIRMVAPEVLAGFATDEELGDPYTEDSEERSVAVPSAVVAKPSTPPVDSSADDAVNAEYEVKPEPEADPSKLTITEEQKSRMLELFTALRVSVERQNAAIKKRGGNNLSDLSVQGADEIIASLEGMLAKQTDDTAGESKVAPEATGIDESGPASAATVAQIKELIKQIAPVDGYHDIGDRVRAKLVDCGLQTLSDLTEAEAIKWAESLAAKNIEVFFGADLRGHAKN